MADKDNASSNEQNENLMRYNSSIVSPDWQFGASNLTSSSMGRISSSNAMTISKSNLLESFSCSTAITVDSSGPTMWDKLPGTQNFGFNDIGVHHSASMPNAVGTRPIDACWTPPNTMLKGDIFVQDSGGFLPPSSAHIPSHSGFIERAARYSCFSGGDFGDIANPLSIPESAYLEDIHGERLKNNTNMAGSSNCVGLLGECKGTPHKNEKAGENMGRSIDEPKRCGSDASNDSDEAEYSSPGGQEELKIPDKDDSSKGAASKKRKRFGQDAEMDQGCRVSDKLAEAVKDHTKLKQKRKQIPTSTSGKPGVSDKVEYVHVRAPRGQATNSHSLAERVRREKISERMKFLQDIVPGCSKVTGKAVMLDEIINYVQSLQRQIEFLSMKLATLNPRVDTNVERLVLTEDILQSRGTSSSLAFPPIMSMGYPTLHQTQGIVQTGIQTLGNSWDVLRRSMNSSLTAMGGGGYKEHSSHVSSTWEDELHKVVHMGSNSTAPPISQDISGSLPPGPMKAEP